eukprot:TRINITY_DN29669_c0_g1_i1.p1 TRINITY_DN29669_c0_g1~~TRINITY_DN29669_c0_g1_i1.p1  ORF type:complete len:927 (+),score=116.79 TRINITY_DN29669_c0_g1_i1:22-2781(+)
MAMLCFALIILLLCVNDIFACTDCIRNGPNGASAQPAWLKELKDDKASTLKAIHFKGDIYENPNLKWTQTSYMQPQMHPYDRFFYDPLKQNYTVNRYIEDVTTRYGGIDALLMWPTYTNIGADDRNQWDMFRAMPGGLKAVGSITRELKSKGVRVLWPYNPWDTGTRREGKPDWEVWPEILKETLGDGFNGDCMDDIPEEFWNASLAFHYPLAFEPEDGGSNQALNWDTMGWGYWTYPKIPVVDRFKFLTSGKFMTNVCDRWNKRKVDNLQMAYFNGDGYETWENVWGTWNGITPRDAEAIRRIAAIERFFGKLGYLNSPLWEPHSTDIIHSDDIFASRWPVPERNSTLWTIINRGKANQTGQQLIVPHSSGQHYYDCYHGVELVPSPVQPLPPPPFFPPGYNAFDDSSAVNGHGGEELGEPVANLSVAACTALCDADARCSCSTYRGVDGMCWKCAACQPAFFAASKEFVVYLKAQGYSRYPSLNAFSGHGGIEIDNDQQAPEDLTVAACQARCEEDRACECVTYREPGAMPSKCWKRASCEPKQFADYNGFAVYVNEARKTRPLPPPQPPPGSYALSFDMDVEGYGCVVSLLGPASSDLAEFLDSMRELTEINLLSLSAEWKYLPQKIVDIPRTPPASSPPPGMVLVPKTHNYSFETHGVMIEGGDDMGVDVQYPWDAHPQRSHTQIMEVGPFYMDKFPVTVENYSNYINATGYRPADEYNWLKNWNGAQNPPSVLLDVPVTYVGLEEARAYCRWAHGGSRLPHSWEWQYAAQGGVAGRLYPWGNDKDTSKFPTSTDGNIFRGPERVTAHSPEGDSAFGISDLVGNVWQYTDEFQDLHTRAVILQGGSNYRPKGSSWYFPQAMELNLHEKYFLMDDRYERAGTIGFRCVKDVDSEHHHSEKMRRWQPGQASDTMVYI